MRFLLSLLLLSITIRLVAQNPPDTLYGSSNIITEIFGKSQDSIINHFVHILPFEKTDFLCLVREYDKEKIPLRNERLVLLRVYNEEFSSLDEQRMNMITKQIMRNDREFILLQIRYLSRMTRLLGATKASQFFQLDNYLDQVTRLYIQTDLPFIRELESDRTLFSHQRPESAN